VSSGLLLVGGGHVELPGGWDVGPLVLALVVVLGMRIAGIPLRPPSLLLAVVAGLVADLAMGATHLSLLAAVSISMVIVAVLALRRAQRERRGAGSV
jgi:hypothetical protein